MKRIPCILLLFAFMMAGTSSLFAQTALEGERSTIFDALQRSGLGKGEVVINQSAAIREMVGERMRGANVETTDSLTFLKAQGYRTQVFSRDPDVCHLQRPVLEVACGRFPLA